MDPISSLDVCWDKISYVIVTAACSKVGFCEENPQYSKEVNLYSNIKLLKFLREKKYQLFYSLQNMFSMEKKEIIKKIPKESNY